MPGNDTAGFVAVVSLDVGINFRRLRLKVLSLELEVATVACWVLSSDSLCVFRSSTWRCRREPRMTNSVAISS